MTSKQRVVAWSIRQLFLVQCDLGCVQPDRANKPLSLVNCFSSPLRMKRKKKGNANEKKDIKTFPGDWHKQRGLVMIDSSIIRFLDVQ